MREEKTLSPADMLGRYMRIDPRAHLGGMAGFVTGFDGEKLQLTLPYVRPDTSGCIGPWGMSRMKLQLGTFKADVDGKNLLPLSTPKPTLPSAEELPSARSLIPLTNNDRRYGFRQLGNYYRVREDAPSPFAGHHGMLLEYDGKALLALPYWVTGDTEIARAPEEIPRAGSGLLRRPQLLAEFPWMIESALEKTDKGFVRSYRVVSGVVTAQFPPEWLAPIPMSREQPRRTSEPRETAGE